MAEISKIKLNNTTYNIKDTTARSSLVEISSGLTAVQTELANKTNTITSTGTNLVTETAVRKYVSSAIGDINSFEIQVVDSLPASGAAYTIYLVPNGNSGSNIRDEYMWINDAWEKLGSTDIDLSNYTPTSEFGALAFKDNASGNFNDYVTGITGASYQPAGSVTIFATTATIESSGSFTPTGSINITSTTSDETFQIGGNVTSPTITVSPSTALFLSAVKTTGALPSLTTTSATYATNGIIASVENEVLTFTAASTASGNLVTAWNSGALPTFDSANAMIGATATASVPVFTGAKYKVTFTGTAKTINVTGSYDKANESATFTGTTATITPTLVKGTKTVSVE